MSLPSILEPEEVTVFLDPEFFRNLGASTNAAIDSIASEANEHLPQQIDGVIQYVVSGAVFVTNAVIYTHVREDIAAVLTQHLDASGRQSIESSQRVARELIPASIRSTADSSKSGVEKSTNFSAEQADACNRSLNGWSV